MLKFQIQRIVTHINKINDAASQLIFTLYNNETIIIVNINNNNSCKHTLTMIREINQQNLTICIQITSLLHIFGQKPILSV